MISWDNFLKTFKYMQLFWEGMVCTISLSALSVVAGFILALVLATMRLAKFKPLRFVATTYVELFRATPMMVQLFLIYHVALAGVSLPTFKLFGFIRFERFIPGVIALSLNSGAYLCEIVRSGIQSVDLGQTEAARSLGLTAWQNMRYIVLPQAMRIAFPSLSNSLIAMVKDTSLASNITVTEMFMETQRIASRYAEFLPLYIEVGLIYLLFCTVLTKVQHVVEKRLSAYGGKGG